MARRESISVIMPDGSEMPYSRWEARYGITCDPQELTRWHVAHEKRVEAERLAAEERERKRLEASRKKPTGGV